MTSAHRQMHWQDTYSTKATDDVSWFQNSPEPSLTLVRKAAPSLTAAIVDIGGGASRLAAFLLSEGFENITVMDLSKVALAAAKEQIGDDAAHPADRGRCHQLGTTTGL